MKKLTSSVLLKTILTIALIPQLVRLNDITFESVNSVAVFEKIGKRTHNIDHYHTFIHKLEIQQLIYRLFKCDFREELLSNFTWGWLEMGPIENFVQLFIIIYIKVRKWG